MAIAQTIQKFMTQHSVPYEVLRHAHTGSSHESASAAHVDEDHIAKAVIVRDQRGYAMVVVPASNRVELAHLRRELNRDFHLATENEISPLFRDCETGAVPPIGPAYGIETFLDEALGGLANVWFEAGDHEELVHTRGDDFRAMLGGVRHGWYSHQA